MAHSSINPKKDIESYRTLQKERIQSLPQAIEVEEAVLGALLFEKEAIVDVADLLTPESFYRPQHQEIYRAIEQLFKEGHPIDIIAVTDVLRKAGKLEMVGGPVYLGELTTKINSAANLEYHARILSEYALKRDLIRISEEIQQKAIENKTDVFELLDYAEHSFFKVSEKNIRRNYLDIQSVIQQSLRELANKKDMNDGLTGVPTGFTELDRYTAGWQKSDLIIIAARPGMGKTAFILSALRNAAVDFNLPVAVFSLEMSAVQLINRLIAAEAEISSTQLKQGKLSEAEWSRMHQRIAKLEQSKIFIDDTPALSVLELRAKARRLKAQHNIQLIAVDYLQLMSGGEQGNKGNREQEIAYISRSLKNIAKELDIPVIALSQLSRAVEQRGGDKRPQLSDLRESGSIEQDADLVLFLYRPEYYGITEDEEGNPTAGVGEVIIAKHRNGALGSVRLRYINEFTKFTNLDNFNLGAFAHEPAFVDHVQPFTQRAQTIRVQSRLNEDLEDESSPDDKQLPPTDPFDDMPPF